METDKRTLLVYGAISVASIAATAAGATQSFGIPLLAGDPWVATFINNLTSSAGINLATGYFQSRKRELPSDAFLKNEDLHKAIGRTIGAIIRKQVSENRLNKGWESVATVAEWHFLKVETGEGSPFEGLSEDKAPKWMSGDLDTIQEAKPLTKDAWRILIDVLCFRAKLTDHTCLNQAENLAKHLEDRFSREFFNMITTDPHCKVALEKMLVLLVGAGFQKHELKLDGQSRVLGEIKTALGPPLDLTLLKVNSQTDAGRSFHYQYQLVPFVGRYREATLAKKFLDQTGDFGWVILIGPSGSGKNRFAQEVALYAKKNGWHAGFLSDFSINWQTCPLDEKTFVIVDDLSGLGSKAATLLTQIRNRNDGKRVRVLFLLRKERDPLVTEFRSEAIACNLEDSEGVFDEGGNRLAEKLELDPIDDSTLRSIVVSIFESQEKEVSESLDTILRGMEGIARDLPLYASFAAYAYATGGSVADWSQEGLTSQVLVQEMRRWKAHIPGPELENALNLLTWATLTDRPQSEIEVNGVPSSISPGAAALVSGLNTSTDEQGGVLPLNPQPVGELFVLYRLQGDDRVRRSTDATKNLVQTATREIVNCGWKDENDSMRAFVARASENYPLLAYQSGLTILPPELKGQDAYGWSLQLRNLCLLGNLQELKVLLTRSEERFTEDDFKVNVWIGTLGDTLLVNDRTRETLMGHAIEIAGRVPQPLELDFVGTFDLAYALGRFDDGSARSEAARLYRRAIELNPNDANAHYNLALLLTTLAKGEPGEDAIGKDPAALNTEAARLYRRAIELNPNDAKAHYNLANLLTTLAKGEPGEDAIGKDPAALNTEAARLYRRAIKLNPNDAEAYSNLAILLTELALREGRTSRLYETLLAEAIEMHETSIGLQPYNASNYANKAWTLFLSYDTPEIKSCLENAVQHLAPYLNRACETEIYFYRYLCQLDSDLTRLKQLITKECLSPGWNLRHVVAWAERNGHPHAEWVRVLAEVITERRPPEDLEPWTVWQRS